MVSSIEGYNEPAQYGTIADFFHDSVERLIQDNLDFVLITARGQRRNVEVLHLIDAKPQSGLPIEYHCVYRAFDSISQITTHGLYLANPWPRSQLRSSSESRYYFDGAEDLIVREDKRKHEREHEFLRGSAIDPSEVHDEEDALILEEFHGDLRRIQSSTPLRPMTMLFNQFARRKQ